MDRLNMDAGDADEAVVVWKPEALVVFTGTSASGDG